MTLAPHITAVCRVYFGTTPRTNRCGQCPLRAPCVTWGGMPARTMEELEQSREWFATEASRVLGDDTATARSKT